LAGSPRSFGGKDWSLHGAARRLERAVSVAGVDHDVKEYADAGHGFLNHRDRTDVPTLFVVMGKMSGATSSTRCRRRTLADASSRSSTRNCTRKPTATYTYVRSRELDGTEHLDVPLTPRHSVGLIGIWKPRTWAGWASSGTTPASNASRRIPIDRQAVRTCSSAHCSRSGSATRLFVNGENLGNVKQTDWDPLLRPARGVDGRWTVDAWPPLDGRNINGGVRLQF
jgi:Dienelactone hydrolase family